MEEEVLNQDVSLQSVMEVYSYSLQFVSIELILTTETAVQTKSYLSVTLLDLFLNSVDPTAKEAHLIWLRTPENVTGP